MQTAVYPRPGRGPASTSKEPRSCTGPSLCLGGFFAGINTRDSPGCRALESLKELRMSSKIVVYLIVNQVTTRSGHNPDLVS